MALSKTAQGLMTMACLKMLCVTARTTTHVWPMVRNLSDQVFGLKINNIKLSANSILIQATTTNVILN